MIFRSIVQVGSLTSMHLREVLEVLQHHELVANQKKCSFAQVKIDYSGHIISHEGGGGSYKCSRCASRSLKMWIGYYRKFIRDYGKISRSLTDSTKKERFNWSNKAQEAFQEVKIKNDYNTHFGITYFLTRFFHWNWSIRRGNRSYYGSARETYSFFSKALGERNLTRSTYEKDLMTVALAIQHWWPYLLGIKFTVFTVHKSLKQLLQQRITTLDQ